MEKDDEILIDKDDLQAEIDALYERIYRISECTSLRYMEYIYNSAISRLKSITTPEDMLHKTVGQACVLIENLKQVIEEMQQNMFYSTGDEEEE